MLWKNTHVRAFLETCLWDYFKAHKRCLMQVFHTVEGLFNEERKSIMA